MLVTAAIFAVRGNLVASRHLAGGDSALKAADSGLRYAQAKLSENPDWRGDDNRVTVDSPDLVIRENNGNVVGIIRAADGNFSQFRLRFNFQDDSQGNADGLADPPQDMWIDHKFMSVNNLSGASDTSVPRADGPAYSVTTNSEVPYQVPSGTVCIAVEGRSGPGLSALSSTNLNPSNLGASVTRKTAEAFFRFGSQPGADAAAMAAGDITAQLLPGSQAQFSTTSKSGIPIVRSKRTVTVDGGNSTENYTSPNGEVHSGDNDLHANSTVATRQEDATSDFYKLEWDKVRKASPTGEKLAAGTYVMWDDHSVHYYNMNYNDYINHITANVSDPGTIVNLQTNSSSLNGPKLTLTGDLYIEPTIGASGSLVNEFNLIPRKGAQEDPPNPVGGGGGGGGNYTGTQISGFINSLPLPTGGLSGLAGWDLPNVDVPGQNSIQFVVGSDIFMLQSQGQGQGAIFSYNNLAAQQAQPNLPVLQSQIAIKLATQANAQSQDPNFLSIISALMSGGSGGDSMQEIPLPGIPTPTLSADDITVEFKPQNAQSAILSAQGNINLASKVRGKGGSMTSEADIRMVGAGSSLAASLDEGLNLYAKGDVVLSSLKPSNNGAGLEYKSFKMKGVIYTWGDFIAKIGHEASTVNQNKWGDFSLQGALVAYGNKGNVTLGDPGDGQGGNISIKARQVKLQFDPAYLAAIEQGINPGHLRQTSYTIH